MLKRPSFHRLVYAPFAAAVILLSTAGCSVEHHGSDKQHEDVSVSTPMGGMHIRENQTTAADVHLPAYPGATLRDPKDSDNGGADIGFNFGDFHLVVKVVSYQTPDSPDKVLAFYRKALATYGDVIECDGHKPIGKGATPQGLTCDDKSGTSLQSHGNVNATIASDSDIDHTLKAGSKLKQHIVEIDNKTTPGNTIFGLVYLELPKGKDAGSD